MKNCHRWWQKLDGFIFCIHSFDVVYLGALLIYIIFV